MIYIKLISKLRKKLSRGVGLFSKIRYYVPKYLLRAIYHAIFHSHLIYACENWGENLTNFYFKKLRRLQENALTIINFKQQTSTSDCIFRENKILRISDFVNYKYADRQREVYPTKPKPQPHHSCCYKPSS